MVKGVVDITCLYFPFVVLDASKVPIRRETETGFNNIKSFSTEGVKENDIKNIDNEHFYKEHRVVYQCLPTIYMQEEGLLLLTCELVLLISVNIFI